MAIALTCDCGKNYRLRDGLAGKRVKCPNCGREHDLPAPEVEADDNNYEVVKNDRPAKPASQRFGQPPLIFPTREPDSTSKCFHDEAPARPKRKRRRSRSSSSGYSGISISPGVIGGILMMVGAVVWFVLGLFFGWVFFYPPILFVLGLIRLVASLMGHEPD